MTNKVFFLSASLLLFGDGQQKVVEKAIPIKAHMLLKDCKPTSPSSYVVECSGGDEYVAGWTCKDETRVLMQRVNGEFICLSPEAKP